MYSIVALGESYALTRYSSAWMTLEHRRTITGCVWHLFPSHRIGPLARNVKPLFYSLQFYYKRLNIFSLFSKEDSRVEVDAIGINRD